MAAQPFPASDREQRRRLLEYFERRRGRPVRLGALLRELRVPRERRRSVRRVLDRLEEEGLLERCDGELWARSARTRGWVGRLVLDERGRPWAVRLGDGRRFRVDAARLRGARPGDLVHVAGERGHWQVVQVAEGAEKPWVGVLRIARGRKYARALSLDRERPGVMLVNRRDCAGAHEGDVVVVEPARGAGRGGLGRVREVLGPLDGPGVDVEVVVRLYGLRREFSRDALAEAARLATMTPRLVRDREVFDDPAPVTLDGETARDFDDAIAVAKRPGGGFRLYVHIADVSAYVGPGTALDEEARQRATSVYFPGTVLPMLPPALSEDLCSLRPGEPRPVQTVILDLDARGAVRRTRFADGLIRSAARLTYRQVAEALEGRRRYAGIPPAVLEMLSTADRLRERLEARRHARGSIDFDLPEPEILLDVEGVVTGVVVEPRNRAHRMIEEFMLAANEAVARYLERRGVPCLYRVHEPPDPARIEALLEMARLLGIRFRVDPQRPHPRDLQRLLERVQGRPDYPVLAQQVLRSMKQARYAPENFGHFGLAAPVYCHFTSPIRRYPDLVVHRLLRACRAGNAQVLRRLGRELEAIAEHCSRQERRAEGAEREIVHWKLVQFLRGREGEEQEGTVVGVAPFGVFVRLDDPPVEGLVRVEALGGRRFEFDERLQELRESASGRRLRVGDRLRVRIVRVDLILRRVDLAPAAALPQGRPRPPKR